MILLIILLILFFGVGGGYYGNRQWGAPGGIGIPGLILVILLVWLLFGGGLSRF